MTYAHTKSTLVKLCLMFATRSLKCSRPGICLSLSLSLSFLVDSVLAGGGHVHGDDGHNDEPSSGHSGHSGGNVEKK